MVPPVVQGDRRFSAQYWGFFNILIFMHYMSMWNITNKQCTLFVQKLKARNKHDAYAQKMFLPLNLIIGQFTLLFKLTTQNCSFAELKFHIFTFLRRRLHNIIGIASS